MPPTSAAQQLDRWLAATARHAACGCSQPLRPALTINGLPGSIPHGAAAAIADYLSSTDDLAPDGWRAFDSDTLLDLATSPLQMLGGKPLAPRDSCPGCDCPGDQCGRRRNRRAAATLASLVARSGSAVLEFPGAALFGAAHPHAFHIWFHANPSFRLQRLRELGSLPDDAGPPELIKAEEQFLSWIADAGAPPTTPESLALSCHLAISLPQMETAPIVQIISDSLLEWATALNRSTPQDLRTLSQPLRSTSRSTVLPFPSAGKPSHP
jgi:hypothetical protein